MVDYVPRSVPDPDAYARILEPQKSLEERVDKQERGAPQRSMAISDATGRGIRADETGFRTVDANGNTIGIFQTSDGTFVIKDAAGQAMARFGALLSDPGKFGGEIWDGTNNVWVKLVTGSSVAWASITGRPATFAPAAHTHAGTDLTSPAPLADGSQRAFDNNVAGTTFYAVWVGNGPGYTLGKNPSSGRYKMNVRDYSVDPADVLQLRPRIFDRRPVLVPPPEGQEGPAQSVPSAVNEYGLIAEEVAEHLPEIVVHDAEGRVDGVRYDLLGLALLDVVKDQAQQIAALQAAVKKLGVPL